MKYDIWNPDTCSCANFEYLTSTIDDSVIAFDEILNAAINLSTIVPIGVTIPVSINF